MKKVILFFIASLSITSLFSQFEKGDKIFETGAGNFGIGSNKETSFGINSKSKYFNIYIEVMAAYFLSPKIAVGAALSSFTSAYKGSSLNDKNIMLSESKSSQWSLTFLPFVRYYFISGEKSRYYGQLAISAITDPIDKYSSTYYNAITGLMISTSTGYNTYDSHFGIRPSIGWNYFFNPQMALNMNLGTILGKNKFTSHNTDTPAIGQPTSSTSTSNPKKFVLDWKIGFTYLLPSKKK